MKKLLLVTFLLINAAIFAQSEEEGWNTTGKVTFLINQSAFSNWQAGGENNFSGNVNFNYDFNYAKNGWIVDNKLIANYGLSYNEGEDVKKTDDRLELNSILGKELKNNWSASFFNNFKTQFTDGYDYTTNFTGDVEDYPLSGFFKPAYLSFGPGFFWKKSENLSVNLAPITSKFTFLFGDLYQFDSDTGEFVSNDDVEMFGVKPGENIRYEFGLNIRSYYKVELMENISMENILTLYSNYIDKPQNVDVDYTMNFVMTINKVFSTNITFQTIYDDNAYRGFQIKETLGIGLNYIF